MSPGHPRAIASERRRPLLPGWRRREAGESIVHVGAQRACMSSSGAARKLGQCGGKPAGPPFGQVPPFLPMSRFLCADAHTHCTCWPEDPQSPRHHGHLSPPSCCSVPLGWRRWSAACDDFLPVALSRLRSRSLSLAPSRAVVSLADAGCVCVPECFWGRMHGCSVRSVAATTMAAVSPRRATNERRGAVRNPDGATVAHAGIGIRGALSR